MKRVTDTSRRALSLLRPLLATRAVQVFDALGRYRQAYGSTPTAYELLRFLQVDQPALDLNAVRPRLTELEDAGQIVKAGKRCCAVTRQRVYTWAVVTPARQAMPYREQPRQTHAVQEVLF